MTIDASTGTVWDALTAPETIEQWFFGSMVGRGVSIEGPDGYTIVFSEPMDTTRTFEDVMGVEFEGDSPRRRVSEVLVVRDVTHSRSISEGLPSAPGVQLSPVITVHGEMSDTPPGRVNRNTRRWNVPHARWSDAGTGES
ncbi:SRPBCC family protein [Salinigranum rubrum]|uniref:hypothetical protein n=1 Tax=Salinigranum rubrum TaxID=755307 RepID=UPI0013A5702C|nr:hypothetical protein [Salinigranum rubrum]